MKKKLFIIFALTMAFALQSKAVLKEKDLASTLTILRNELTTYHQEQQKQMQRNKRMKEQIRNELFTIMQKSNQNSLMLYSQKPDYVFDLTYACHEATEQYENFQSSILPFKNIINKIDVEVARYDSLVTSLNKMPVIMLSDKSKIDRNVCLTLAVNIKSKLEANREQLSDYIKYYKITAERLKNLNDYANKRYNDIQSNIFINGGDNYLKIISQLKRNLTQTKETVEDKYDTSKKVNSQWDTRMIFGLFVIIAFYGLISVILNIVGIKYLMPKKYRTESFVAKRPCIIMATTVITFAIILGIIRFTVKQNFIIMASNLLVEYAWLFGIILISLLLRVNGSQIKSAFRIYSPLIVIGFIVISFRIILIPNDLVNMIFPPILLICTLWQWNVIGRHNDNIPKSDVFFTYVSLIVFTASLISSWMGYTLLSVQMLIWWIMQLACILTITCLSRWIKIYSIRKKFQERPITYTWFHNLIYAVFIPLLGVGSVMLAIYWAADIFNLSDLTWQIFTYKFVNMKQFNLSIFNIAMVISLWFLFSYLNVTIKAFIKYHFTKADKTTAESRNVMAKNVVQVFVWGIWFLVSLSIFNVSNTWIVVVSGGLSTGVGFASKDILENIYYGISLMAGRIKVGDWIECDGTRGKVSSISYTSTMVEATDGSIIAFQNSQLFNKNYKNMTRNHGFELDTLNVGVAYGSDIAKVKKLLCSEITKLACLDKKRGVKIILNELGDNSVNLKILVWVPVRTHVFDSAEILECVYETLNNNNIEIPFPQRDIHIKNTEESAAV